MESTQNAGHVPEARKRHRLLRTKVERNCPNSKKFGSLMPTREWLPKSLVPLARAEFAKLLANVVAHNHPEAFQANGPERNDRIRQAETAWLQLLMFPKACLRSFRRGQRPIQALAFTRNLLLRWRAGERLTLWAEIPEATGQRKQQDPDKLRQEQVQRLVAMGRLSQATQRLTSPGLAADTAEVRSKLKEKFPPYKIEDWPARAAPPPAGEITAQEVFKAVMSIKKRAGPGASGLRGDFLRQCLGSKGDDPFTLILRDFLQLLADGQAPSGLRPWLSGGVLIGTGKAGKSLTEDARPIVTGEVLRKLVFKCTLRHDLKAAQERLEPKQLAVGTAGGAEVMAHATRRWLDRARHQTNTVLLQSDIRNAFNCAFPHEFLQDCAAFLPSSAKWADYVYGRPSHLCYSGELRTSARGQQGCPSMGPLFCLLRQRQSMEARVGKPCPTFQPEFSDDSFSGGRTEDVLSCFKEEIRLAGKYGLTFDLAKCTVYLPAGAAYQGDLSEFVNMGVTIKSGDNIEMLKSLVCATEEGAQGFCMRRQAELDETFRALAALPQKHVALHLLRHCMGGNTVNYLLRTAPKIFTGPLLKHFDSKSRECLEEILGYTLSEESWAQRSSRLLRGGWGCSLRAVRRIALSWLQFGPLGPWCKR